MKRTSRAICIALALVLALSLAACGSDANKDVDINALADELLNSATFGETMNPLESSVALGLYACAEGTEAVAYAGTEPPPRRSPYSTAAAPRPPKRS